MENPRHKDDFFGNNQIIIPKEVIHHYVKDKFFRNALYVTEVGYSSKHHYKFNQSNSSDCMLIYCLYGKGYCETQHDAFTIQANEFMLLSADQHKHFHAAPQNPGSIYWVHFNGSMINELKSELGFQKYERPTLLPFGVEVLEAWNKVYSSLSNGFEPENLGYANLSLYHLISLFVFPNKQNENIQKDEDQLEKSIAFMKENLQKHLTVDGIAKEFNYSSSHYSTLFKQKTGLSPIDYFIRLKIQYACQLLTQSNLIIKEVAQKVGYEDPFYFSRIFKKVTGKSPVEYKGQAKIKSNKASIAQRQFELTL
nr:AraC family transcriptional regulator [Pedobacter sp. ASV19]